MENVLCRPESIVKTRGPTSASKPRLPKRFCAFTSVVLNAFGFNHNRSLTSWLYGSAPYTESGRCPALRPLSVKSLPDTTLIGNPERHPTMLRNVHPPNAARKNRLWNEC